MRDLLKKLVSIPAVCGREQEIILYLWEKLHSLADEAYVDGLGNLVICMKGSRPGPTLHLSAHSDEVGFIIKKVEPSGLLRFEKVGGNDDRNLLISRVIVKTDKGLLPGVIGTQSAHMRPYDKGDHIRASKEMYIDIGAKDAQSALVMGVEPGCTATWYSDYLEFGDGRVMGHAFDDRAGCAVLVKVLEETDFKRVAGEVYFVFSVQEELGIRGSKTASAQIAADVAIAVDATVVSDTPEAALDNNLALGKGPAIKVMDGRTMSSSAVVSRLCQVAQQQQIPYQLEIFPGIGTDAGEMQFSGSGVPTGAVSIPSRYSHSCNEVIDLQDLENSKELLIGFIYSMEAPSEFRFANCLKGPRL